MIFPLIQDFAAVFDAMPQEHPCQRILALLDEAIRRDVHFIERHPTTLFQCLWNTCWWYDCQEAAAHHDSPGEGWPAGGPPWARTAAKLSELLQTWLEAKTRDLPGFVWLRSLRPPPVPLGAVVRCTFAGHDNSVESVAFSPDGRRIASGSYDQTARLWDADTGRLLACLDHEDWVNGVAFSPDGQLLVSVEGSWQSSRPGAVRVWDAASGTLRDCLRGHLSGITGVAVAPDGRRITSCAADGTVRIWDLGTSKEIACLDQQDLRLRSVAWSPDGHTIASAGRSLSLWDVAEGRLLASLPVKAESIAFSPDGRRLVSGAGDNTIRVWDVKSGKELACLRGHDLLVRSVAFAPDGRRLASASHDRTVRVWDSETGRMLTCLRGHDMLVRSVAFSPDGRSLVSGGGSGAVRIWDANGEERLPSLREQGRLPLPTSLALSADGRRALSVISDGPPQMWDVASGTLIPFDNPKEGTVTAFVPGGCRMASLSSNGVLSLRDDGSEQHTQLAGHEGGVRVLAFSPDGQRIASAGNTSRSRARLVHIGEADSVSVWDVGTGNLLARWEVDIEVWALAFSPDGRRLATAGGSSRTWRHGVQVWDTETGNLFVEVCLPESRDAPRVERRRVRAIAFSRDGSRLVSTADDRSVRVWDLASARCLETISGTGDVCGIAGGLPWRALCRGPELVIESASGYPVAWHPISTESPQAPLLASNTSKATVAALVGARLHLLRLCGPFEAEAEAQA